MPSRKVKVPHLGKDSYDSVEEAVKELGTLWVLNVINTTLAHTKMQREHQRTKRAEKEDA